jgi:predicted nuclease of predicted toxin-antitoxin system
MSRNVAEALRLLDKDVQRAKAGTAGKSTPDSEVARLAKRQVRVVFTNNFDMVVAAVEEDVRVIWFLDRRNNSPTRYNTAKLFFARWDQWEALLASPEVHCLRVSMTRTRLLTKEQARAQASALDRKTKTTRKKFKAQAQQAKLFFSD